MKIVAGIDGGGTKTVLEIKNLTDGTITRAVFGPFNLNSIGKEAFEEILGQLFGFIEQKGDCLAICIGAAGSSNPDMEAIIRRELHDTKLKMAKLILKGDHEIALFGATEGKPGIALIAGTGSICIGINEKQELIRVGGWGHLIGDEGSGYWLGREALAAVVRGQDGRNNETLLTELIMEKWKLSTMEELIRQIYSHSEKDFIASLAPLVIQAAERNDKMAERILDRASEELTVMVRTAGKKLGCVELPLFLFGGLLANDTLLKEIFLKKLRTQNLEINVKLPRKDAASGAVLVAEKQIIN